MRTETLEQANELTERISQMDDAIEKINGEKFDTKNGFGFSLYWDMDQNDFKKNILSFLKQRRQKLQKEFANLK